MPWNEPDNGRKDPWRNNNGGGGDRPPDLDEVFARLKSSFGGFSGGPGGGLIALVVAAALLVWLMFSTIHVVDEPDRGVVLRFGEHVRTLSPGLRFTFPSPIENVYKVNVSAVRSVEDQGQMLTRDENLVDMDFEVQYQVADGFNYLFKVRQPEVTVKQTAESALRQVIGNTDMDFVLQEGRADISARSRELMQEILDRYETGILVQVFNLKDVRPPRQVKDAFDDAIKAREDEQRFVNEAEAYANTVVPVARGQAARILEEASGYKDSVIARAEGEAQRFSLLFEEYRAAPQVTRDRLHLDAVQDVLDDTRKVIVDGEGTDNVMYLPLDQLMRDDNRLPRTSNSGAAAGTGSRGQASGTTNSNADYRQRDMNRRSREERQ